MRRFASLLLSLGFITACQQASEKVPEPALPAVKTESVAPIPQSQNLPTGKVEDIDFASYAEHLASPIDLELGDSRLDAIDKIRLYFAPEPGTNLVNLTSSTFELDDGSVMLFARNDLPDDSVFAEEVYAVFSGSGGVNKFNQELAAFGLRVKCRRGDNAMEWTTELCP